MDNNEIWNRLQLSGDISAASEILQKSRILIIGAGGIGSDLALRLAGCRISHLTLIDGDEVSIANIPHSSIFLTQDVGQNKADVVRKFLILKFPGINISVERQFIQQCSPEVFEQHDLIICAPDNDQTRFWVNFYAVKFEKRALFVGVGGPRSEWTGYVYFYKPGISGCFVCFAKGGEQSQAQQDSYATVALSTQDLDEDRKKCGGVNIPVPTLAPVVGIISSYAASVVLRSIISVGEIPTYTYLNLKLSRLLVSEVKNVSTCVVCGKIQEYDLSSILVEPQPGM